VHEDEPATEKELIGHGVHELEALAAAYVLAGQAVQEDDDEIDSISLRLLLDPAIGVSKNLSA